VTDESGSGILHTSTVILLGRITDPGLLPVEPLITAVTLAGLSVGPLVNDDPAERAARQGRLQHAEADSFCARRRQQPQPHRTRVLVFKMREIAGLAHNRMENAHQIWPGRSPIARESQVSPVRTRTKRLARSRTPTHGFP